MEKNYFVYQLLDGKFCEYVAQFKDEEDARLFVETIRTTSKYESYGFTIKRKNPGDFKEIGTFVAYVEERV